MRVRTLPWALIGACLLGGLLGGCATPAREASGPDGSQTSRVPADPIYRHTFTTPRGGVWDFQLGGGYSSDR